ncbi:MAG TPA: hypothetical protein PKA64_10710, partial [Myxococcota bacterium]|nr:hypothetical protein [Myxococcota bacterium]
MRPQDLLRLRTSRVTPGEGWDAEGVLASRLQARNIETRAPRALLEECLTRVVSRAEGSQLRAVRVAVETERPAPLLMRLMRKKSTLDAVGRTREVVREAREPR